MPASSNAKLQEMCDRVFAIDQSVRFAGVLDKMGKLLAGGMRPGIKPLESIKDMDRLYVEIALRNAMRSEFDKEFGRTVYAFSEREKIKIAVFPMQDGLILLLSLEREKPHDRIISKVLELVS